MPGTLSPPRPPQLPKSYAPGDTHSIPCAAALDPAAAAAVKTADTVNIAFPSPIENPPKVAFTCKRPYPFSDGAQ